MYLDHFGLHQAPFGITPNPAFFYTGSKRGDILDALIYAVTSGEGIVKVSGEVGSGKTMLCRMLESKMPANVEVIYLVNPTLGREDVGFVIAGELGLSTAGLRPDEMIRLLQEDLIKKHVEGKQVVLLVEEAQAMGLDTLEEIRLFSNLETAHHKLLQIVLFGQPELDENLAVPRMRQLKERITHSFKVPPMPREVIPEFLMFRMRAAGYRGPQVFDKGAVSLLAKVSRGIVRRINILADKALLAAYADNAHQVTARHMRSAIHDSEFAHVGLGLGLSWRLAGAVSAGVLALGVAAVLLWPRAAAPLPPAIPAAPAVARAAALASVDHPLFEARLAASPSWLAQQSTDDYTIVLELLPRDNQVAIERLLEQFKPLLDFEQVYVYPASQNGAPRYGIAFGSYAVRGDAKAKQKALSAKMGRDFTIRTIGGILHDKRSGAK